MSLVLLFNNNINSLYDYRNSCCKFQAGDIKEAGYTERGYKQKPFFGKAYREASILEIEVQTSAYLQTVQERTWSPSGSTKNISIYRGLDIKLKLHFSIIGHAESPTEILLVEWLQDMLSEYNERSGSPLDSYHVLVREDDVPE